MNIPKLKESYGSNKEASFISTQLIGLSINNKFATPKFSSKLRYRLEWLNLTRSSISRPTTDFTDFVYTEVTQFFWTF